MKRLTAVLLLVIASLQLAPAYAFSLFTKSIQGSGQIDKQTRLLPAFNRIESETTGRVEIIQGNQESITIESDDNIIPAIETYVENGGLKIRHPRIDLNTKTLNITVRVKELRSITLAGSGSIFSKALAAKKLTINSGGSGSIEMNKLDVRDISVNLGGSGKVQLPDLQSSDLDVALGGSGSFKSSGNVNILSLSMGGSGLINTMQLKAKIVKLSMAGSGQVILAAKEQLSASVAGSGDIQYYGDPQTHLSMMGTANVKRLGAFPI